MKRTSAIAAIPLLMFASLVARAADSPDAQQQVTAITGEYDKAMNDFSQAYSAATTDEQRQKLLDEKYPQPARFSPRLLKIARDNPKTLAAFDALKWIMERDRGGQPGSPHEEALSLLTRDFAADPRAGDIATTMMWSSSPAEEAFVRAMIDKNPDRNAKAIATYILGRMYKGRVDDRGLSDADRAAASKRSENLFENARKDYADVNGGMHGTIGASADAELFELHNLAIGKVAPDIVGEDINGKPMKLSDLRGKVVMLDFWGDW
jgi:hypothetical protein